MNEIHDHALCTFKISNQEIQAFVKMCHKIDIKIFNTHTQISNQRCETWFTCSLLKIKQTKWLANIC